MIIIYILAIVFYFLPTIMASDKQNVGAIFTLNLLLGWTFIAWVGALIWALADKRA